MARLDQRALRVARTLGAQLYNQIVTILVQLSLVPILLRLWGTHLYGDWLLLSAIPFYLTFSDFGFTFIAKNEMVIAVAAGSRERALLVFQSTLALLMIAVPVLLVAIGGLLFAIDPAHALSLGTVAAGPARAVLMLLIANVLLYQFFLLVCAGIRSENRPATESVWGATSRLGEGLAIAAAAVSGGGVVTAALCMVANRLVFLALASGWLRRASPWIVFGLRHARRAELRRLLTPAIAYMFMPLGQALMIQGPVLVVGKLLGAVAVVTFSTSRTLARLGTAATNMLNNSFVSEYSALAGARNQAGFKRLFRVQMLLSAGAILAYVVAILVLARPVMAIFTHHKVQIVEPFFLLVVVGVAGEMLWSALFAPISAVNRHRAVTLFFLVLGVAGISACYPLTAMIGLPGAAAAVLTVHLLMVPACLLIGRPSSAALPRSRLAEEDVRRTEAESYAAP